MKRPNFAHLIEPGIKRISQLLDYFQPCSLVNVSPGLTSFVEAAR